MNISTATLPKALDLGEEVLLGISKKPMKESIVALHDVLMEAMGRPRPPRYVTYTYGSYNELGDNTCHPKPRMKSVPPSMLRPGVVLDDRPDELAQPLRGNVNEIHGDYSIVVNGVEFSFAWGKWRREFSAAANRWVENVPEPEMQNFPNGIKVVDTKANYAYYCFLSMHPMNVTSPVRRQYEDICHSRGLTVGTREELLNRNALIKGDVKMSREAEKLDRDTATVELIGVLRDASDEKLRGWFRACNFSIDPSQKLRAQYLSKLKELLESRSQADMPLRNQLVTLMEGDPERVGHLVSEAFRLKVVECIDGEYSIDGRHVAEIACPANRSGEEIDYFTEQVTVHNLVKIIDEIDALVTGIKNQIVASQDEYADHDNLVNRMIAEKTLWVDEKMKQWKVKSETGGGKMVRKYDPAQTESVQVDEFKKWARTFPYDVLLKKLAAFTVE